MHSATTEKEQFDQDGFVIYRNVLDSDLIREADAHVDWLMKKHPELRPEDLNHTLVQHDPFWVRLVSDDRLLDIAEQYIGPNIALFASHYICKPPHDGQAVLWHQDGSYWPLEPMEVVTLWLAVTDASPDNGCMRVIPGTQNMDLQELRQRRDVPNVLNSGMDDALVNEGEAVDCVMSPGDVSVHHPNVVHGSNPNTSPRWRRGLTIRYIPTSTRIGVDGPETHPSAFLLRGTAPEGVNQYNPKPRYREGECMSFAGSESWR
tara:strand:- start:48 stop:833 length:786 start_codon:yes stop_codon:yes gene_type:complete